MARRKAVFWKAKGRLLQAAGQHADSQQVTASPAARTYTDPRKHISHTAMTTTRNIITRKLVRLQALALAALAAVMASCSADEPGGGHAGYGRPVTFTLRLAVSQGGETRAWDGQQGDNLEGEGMNSWFVVIADNSDAIVKIISEDNVDGLETDEVEQEVTLAAGTYKFYSFANIKPAQVLGGEAEGGAFNPADAVFTVNGNSASLPEGGIPMSNVQEISVTGSTTDVSLWVVRMLAKIELRFTNATGGDITVNSVTLGGVTQNAEGNLMLLPRLAGGGETGACAPNVSATATAGDFEIECNPSIKIGNDGAPVAFTFYVNESAKANISNPHGLFTLTLAVARGGQGGAGGEDMRYALITNDSENWEFIARNDYRVIPVTLTDYGLDIVPYDFPPIGVYPASVKHEDGLFTCTFHAGGHFHLVPVVRKYSTGQELDCGTGQDQWQYASWASAGGNDDIYADGQTTGESGDGGGAPAWVESGQCVMGRLKDDAGGRAFHTLTVNVNDGTAAQRTLTYDICIIKE